MKHLILVAALALGVSTSAMANELDNESSVTNQAMNGTVVVRVDSRNNQASVVTSEKVMASEQDAQTLAQNGSFKKLSSENVRSELDQDAGASSWYFYNGYNYYNQVYWYGNWYAPYYQYNYGYYRYYYYSNYWW